MYAVYGKFVLILDFLDLPVADFTEDLLEVHEAEAKKLKEHYELHKDLYFRYEKINNFKLLY